MPARKARRQFAALILLVFTAWSSMPGQLFAEEGASRPHRPPRHKWPWLRRKRA